MHENSIGHTGAQLSTIIDEVDSATNIFRKEVRNIELYIADIVYVTNSPYYNVTSDWEANQQLLKEEDDSHVHIHVINQGPDGTPGRALGTNTFIASNRSGTTLVHELGHIFGLEHTHRGIFPCLGDNETCDDCKQEPVSRTRQQPPWCVVGATKYKCAVNGDGLCDTPAEPNLGKIGRIVKSGGNCIYVATHLKDNWNDTFVPNEYNIMSYSKCRTDFTYGQVGVMLDELQKNKFDQIKSTSADISISGVDFVCANSQYTYTVPSQGLGADYRWSVPSGWTIISGQHTNILTVQPQQLYEVGYIYVSIIDGVSVEPMEVEVDDQVAPVNGPNSVPRDGTCKQFTTEYYPGITYTWTAANPSPLPTGQPTICGGQGSNTVSIRTTELVITDGFYVNVTLSNVCGISITGTKYVEIDDGGGPIAEANPRDDLPLTPEAQLYPNPATDRFITVKAPRESTLDRIRISNLATGQSNVYNTSEKNRVFNNGTLKLDISSLKPGVYILKYELDGITKNSKLIIR